MTKQRLLKKVTELKELKAQQADLQERISSIEEDIKAEMVRQQKEELKAGIFTIRYKTISSCRFDKETFKSKYIDLYNQFVKVGHSNRFTIN